VRTPLRLLATLGPTGYAPVAPATVASALVAAIGWFVPPPALPITLGVIAAGALAAVWICGEAEKDLGHDAGPIVADEAVGQSLALLLVPHTLVAFGASFLLFRLFDIWKPFPVRNLEKLPGGWGIMADDWFAGVYAAILLKVALHFSVL